MKAVENIVAACACALAFATAGCASAPRAEPVSTTTTTAADAPDYTSQNVELKGARAVCSPRLRPEIKFAPRTAALLPGESLVLDRWAQCLNLPHFAHTTIVLLGGDEPSAPADLFIERAHGLRDALVARGIDPQRVVIGASNVSRDGGPYVTTSGVLVEVTTVSTIRGFPRQASRYGVR